MITKLAASGLSIEKIIVIGFVFGCIAIISFFVREWFKRHNVTKIKDMLVRIEMNITSLKTDLARIDGRIDTMGKTVSSSHDDMIRAKMEIKALWRAVDPPNRKSDNGGNGQ